MTRCSCGHLSDAHNPSNGVCIWRNCHCMRFDPDSETDPDPRERAIRDLAYELTKDDGPYG